MGPLAKVSAVVVAVLAAAGAAYALFGDRSAAEPATGPRAWNPPSSHCLF